MFLCVVFNITMLLLVSEFATQVAYLFGALSYDGFLKIKCL